jgi:hypothetical protein
VRQPARSRALSWLIWCALAVLTAVQGCDCGPTDVDARRFACEFSEDCAPGYLCLAGECRQEGEPVEDPDAGRPDGGTDGGQPDGGGTDGGPPDGGGTDGGTPGGTPTQLAFASPPQTVVVGQCSGEVVIETQNATGGAATVTGNTNVTLAATPASGVSFFSDAACLSSLSLNRVRVNAGTSRASFYFRASNTPQMVQVRATATGLTAATQDETVIAGPPASLSFTTLSQTLQAGVCSAAAEVEARDANGNPTTSSTPLSLSVTPATGFTFFTDATCTTATTTVPFASGSTRARFYFKGITGGVVTLSATHPGASAASQSETIRSVVRTGTCSLAAGSSTVSCPISPAQFDVAKTLLLFQATSAGGGPNDADIRCSLATTSSISCVRGGTTGAVTIQWQTAELATGLKVQHLQTTCSGSISTSVTLPQSVSSLGNTFLLVSADQAGVTLGPDDFFSASISEPDHVDFDFTEGCSPSMRMALQVVELTGASVTRGVTGPMLGTQTVVTGLPPVNLSSSALLFTWSVSGPSTPGLCDRVIRGELTSPTSITFSRGQGATGCEDHDIDSISWERIDFGDRARAQQVPVTMSAGTTVASVPITAVDLTRTLSFASGQAQCGQGLGEGSFSGDDIIGEVVGRHALTSSTTLEVTRATSSGTAQWSSTVLQLVP